MLIIQPLVNQSIRYKKWMFDILSIRKYIYHSKLRLSAVLERSVTKMFSLFNILKIQSILKQEKGVRQIQYLFTNLSLLLPIFRLNIKIIYLITSSSNSIVVTVCRKYLVENGLTCEQTGRLLTNNVNTSIALPLSISLFKIKPTKLNKYLTT